MIAGLDKFFEILTTGADISQFISLSRSFADEKRTEELLKMQEQIIGILTNKRRIDPMKLLKDLIAKADDTLDEIEWYAEKAHHLKTEHKATADVYIKIAEMHVTIYNMLHERMVAAIDEYKRQGHEPPKEMLIIWDYEHEKIVKEFAEVKYLIDEYKKSY